MTRTHSWSTNAFVTVPDVRQAASGAIVSQASASRSSVADSKIRRIDIADVQLLVAWFYGTVELTGL